MQHEDENNGDWGRDTLPHDILRIYDPAGKWESAHAASIKGFDDKNCIFVRDCSPGEMHIFSASDVARILISDTHSLSLRIRMAQSLGDLSEEKKATLASHLTQEAIHFIERYNPAAAQNFADLSNAAAINGTLYKISPTRSVG